MHVGAAATVRFWCMTMPLVYVTNAKTEARYWRLADLLPGGPTRPFDITFLAYEGAPAMLDRFSFESRRRATPSTHTICRVASPGVRPLWRRRRAGIVTSRTERVPNRGAAKSRRLDPRVTNGP